MVCVEIIVVIFLSNGWFVYVNDLECLVVGLIGIDLEFKIGIDLKY